MYYKSGRGKGLRVVTCIIIVVGGKTSGLSRVL